MNSSSDSSSSSSASFNMQLAIGCAKIDSLRVHPADLLAARCMYAGHGSAHPFDVFPHTPSGNQPDQTTGDRGHGSAHLCTFPASPPRHNNYIHQSENTNAMEQDLDREDHGYDRDLSIITCHDVLNLSSLAFEMELDDDTRDCSILSCRCNQCGRVVDVDETINTTLLQLALRQEFVYVSTPIKFEVCQEKLLSCGHCNCKN